MRSVVNYLGSFAHPEKKKGEAERRRIARTLIRESGMPVMAETEKAIHDYLMKHAAQYLYSQAQFVATSMPYIDHIIAMRLTGGHPEVDAILADAELHPDAPAPGPGMR